MQPEKLKSPDFIAELRSLNADLFVVVAFRMLPEIVWNMPEHGTVNVHGSLLPQYRGAAPINWAIINGEKETGVTVFRLKHEIDTGDILLRRSTPILESDNVESVHDKLMVLGANALVESIDLIANGNPSYLPQLESTDLKSAPKIFKETCQINWSQKGPEIQNFIQGLSPYPAAWTTVQNGETEVTLKIFGSSFTTAKTPGYGRLETDQKTFLKISSTDGWLSITELQISGKKRMGVQDLLRGFSFETNAQIK
jgi:methionyl-tRNA formyltransferase